MSSSIYLVSFLVLCISIMCYYWQLQVQWDLNNELSLASTECQAGMHEELPATSGDGYNPYIMSSIYSHCFFSDTYTEARKRFLELANSVATEQVSLPIYSNDSLQLTTEIAIISGKKDVTLLHISGTHGVEAFAGSASQLALLTLLKKEKERLGACTSFPYYYLSVHHYMLNIKSHLNIFYCNHNEWSPFLASLRQVLPTLVHTQPLLSSIL